MSDQVLTEEEKDALVEGVESGEVEVQTGAGAVYASVTSFDVAPRNRIVTNSFPRLQSMNRKLAGDVAKTGSVLLNAKIDVSPGPLSTSTWGEFCESADETALIFEFSAAPLEGSAAMHMQATPVQNIVETFYGGSKENPPRHEIEGFTRGEMNVVSLFCSEVLKGIARTWQSLIELQPETVGVHQSTDVVEVVDNGATVIHCEFTLHLGEDQHRFFVVWPTQMLAALLPVLEGAKRERDAAEDARWEQVIRDRVPRATVDVSTRVGSAQMTLRDVAALEAGDIIDLDNPRRGTVFAGNVPVLEGNFGVHDGRYAIETTRWLSHEQRAGAS
ncbi:MAG: FliM/FliN family flagellar motor switch protein [Woeseiaceae bacterium]|nr:FliM/FliN family flagellar motor switch protein [Woeseiaceae bacterium]